MDGLIRRCLWVGYFVFFYAHEVRAEYRCEPAVASIVSVEGQVEVVRNKKVKWQPVGLKTQLCAGDTLRIGTRSRAAILLTDQTVLRLDQGTSVSFPPVAAGKTNWLDLLKGAIHFISRTPGKLGVKTPFVNAAIEGTEFVLRVEPAQTALWVYEGRVAFSNTRGRLSIESGEAAIAKAGLAPQQRLMIKPEDAVQWALYYPPIIDFRSADTGAAPGAVFIDNALQKYRQTDLPGAFKNLDQVPPGERDISFYNTRAAILLSVGRVDEAQPDIEKSLELDKNNASGSALKSIIALAKNQAESSLNLAQQAAKLDPESPVPQIALSYAHQAQFDITKALESAEKAAELSPQDALAWSRVSELRLSQGDLDGATEAAEKAVELDPGLARTQTIMGFADLTRLSIDEAQAAFDKAIEIDPSDPLPQLGSGLAMIRRGKLKEGAEKIEIAASLDPDNALIRSYLGKAYFEQKRGPLVETEFARAKQLDPNDPTPWFYDAIQKQSTNRPVEALHDLQKAIELNDNRAVYRSSLLLDQDVAARGASLGRIYSDLGFEQRALVEGWHSLNSDPANHSAHRLLADTYAVRPRHEIARVSELLQTQLLQPLNINNLQAELAESNVTNLEGAGPADSAFNEFNPLFVRDRLALQARGLVGNNGTWGDNVVISGIKNRLSYSLGQFHYESDGFRKNNDLKHNIYNAFIQGQITPELNLQAEYRYRETDQGDLELRFYPNDFGLDDRRRVRQRNTRLGARYSPSPHSDVIASAIYTNRDVAVDQLSAVPEILGRSNAEGFQAESQYIAHYDWFNAVVGGGISDLDFDDRLNFQFPLPLCPLPSCNTVDDSNTEHVNTYVYTNTTFPSKVIWTVGLSYDSFHEPDIDVDRFNPKIGLQWNITEKIRVRMAYLRAVKRPLVTDQTIEPTQVSGFNQFFDDIDGTRSERYGVGIDTRFSDNFYGGAEYSRRNLKVPGPRIQNASTFGRRERLSRAYLYWTPHPYWATSVEGEFEQFRRSSTDPSVTQSFEIRNVDSLIIPISLRYFLPSGFSATLGTNFVHQEVDFPAAVSNGRDNETFFLVNGALEYRLPKRLGIIGLEIRNLLDKKFLYRDLNIQTSGEIVNPRFIPDRTISFTARLAFN